MNNTIDQDYKDLLNNVDLSKETVPQKPSRLANYSLYVKLFYHSLLSWLFLLDYMSTIPLTR